MRKLLLFVVLSSLMAATLACRPVNYVMNVNNYSSPVTQDIEIYEASTKEIRSAIIRACTSLTWRPKDHDATTLRATILVRGKHTVVVDIMYDKKSFTIKYVNSINMDATPDGKIHPNYNNWVLRLANTIDQQLSLRNL